jgi:hypothetical protein
MNVMKRRHKWHGTQSREGWTCRDAMIVDEVTVSEIAHCASDVDKLSSIEGWSSPGFRIPADLGATNRSLRAVKNDLMAPRHQSTGEVAGNGF